MTENPSATNVMSFIVGFAGILGTLLMGLIGWMPLYMVVGVILMACLLYEQAMFATGIVGMTAISIFSSPSLGMFPIAMYWSIVIVVSFLLAIKVILYAVKV